MVTAKFSDYYLLKRFNRKRGIKQPEYPQWREQTFFSVFVKLVKQGECGFYKSSLQATFPSQSLLVKNFIKVGPYKSVTADFSVAWKNQFWGRLMKFEE